MLTRAVVTDAVKLDEQIEPCVLQTCVLNHAKYPHKMGEKSKDYVYMTCQRHVMHTSIANQSCHVIAIEDSCVCCTRTPGPLLRTWIIFNSGTDNHTPCKVLGWNYWSVPKPELLHCYNLKMDEYFYHTLCNGRNYLSTLGLKLNLVSKGGPVTRPWLDYLRNWNS